jgi:hypothetical protein
MLTLSIIFTFLLKLAVIIQAFHQLATLFN